MAKTSVDKKYIRDSIQNVQTNEITISEDKLRLKLERHIKRIRKASGVLSYLGVAITCIGVLAGTDFKEIGGITPDMWKTVFFLAAVAFIILTLYHGFYALFYRTSVDSMVNDIKTPDLIEHERNIWARFMAHFKSDNNVETEKEEEK